jgi:hypothetical protein
MWQPDEMGAAKRLAELLGTRVLSAQEFADMTPGREDAPVWWSSVKAVMDPPPTAYPESLPDFLVYLQQVLERLEARGEVVAGVLPQDRIGPLCIVAAPRTPALTPQQRQEQLRRIPPWRLHPGWRPFYEDPGDDPN